MSQIVQNKVAYPIPIGRRIAEIMEEKGGAFSRRSFAPRVGLSKDTLGRIIDGERHIKPSELQKIADGLSISVERLKQDDTSDLTEELHTLLQNKRDSEKALRLATQLSKIAIGMTEKYETLNNLGKAYFAIAEYPEAHDCWQQAYNYAKQIHDKYGNSDPLYTISCNLMLSFSVRKEFSNLSEILTTVEPVFEGVPDKMGAICFSKAMVNENLGDLDKARENIYKSLAYYLKTDRKNDIGRAELNVGYFEYKQRNYQEAKRYLGGAIVHLSGDTYYELIGIKEYVKTLLKIGETDKAAHWIEQIKNRLDEYPDLKAKFLILQSVATQDISHAESVFHLPSVSKTVQRLTAKF